MASRASCVSECRRCPRVVPGSGVEGAGPRGPAVMFIGEAPGRFGAGKTGIPFLGDESGRRFDLLLEAAGLSRDEVFITNAVRCLPLDSHGRNRRPATSEVRECGSWLTAEIDVVQPRLVVALGTVALDALNRFEPHGLRLATGVGKHSAWRGRMLMPLYHPAARSAVHRPWETQMGDWHQLGRMVRTGRMSG